ncbi:tetratricopeptide repeat domain protein [Thioploca ingrica]|uniref:Tetratricopeptide repeat domain protein n=1 Tax=Thioploca ingrica TaxID=40754 RepID=A0A090ACT4_9GAMM|nr:tetratricopeptide repeat domain protein [Thioploca ingrica]
MIKFYQNYRRGNTSVAVALNQAQLWLRNATNQALFAWSKQLPVGATWQRAFRHQFFYKKDPNIQPYQAPYHWAAFCAIGQ